MKNTINFVMSDEVEIGSAVEQPIKNNLADWNEKEVGKLPTSNSQNIPVTYT